MESRGAVNCYVETSFKEPILHAKRIWTMNLSNGVTPFILVVDGKEYASEMYRLRGEGIVINKVFYRPLVAEFQKLEKSLQEHVLNGGLLHTADFGVAHYSGLVPDDWESCQKVFQTLYGTRQEKTPGR